VVLEISERRKGQFDHVANRSQIEEAGAMCCLRQRTGAVRIEIEQQAPRILEDRGAMKARHLAEE
jgi:hypothetical protein